MSLLPSLLVYMFIVWTKHRQVLDILDYLRKAAQKIDNALDNFFYYKTNRTGLDS